MYKQWYQLLGLVLIDKSITQIFSTTKVQITYHVHAQKHSVNDMKNRDLI